MTARTSTTSTSTTGTSTTSRDRAWQGFEDEKGHRQVDSRSGFEINDEGREWPEGSLAVTRAGSGSVAWQAAHEAHREAPSVSHGQVYGLTAEWAATLAAVGSLMRLVAGEVAGYADTVERPTDSGGASGWRVYDDERREDPRELLARAAQALELLASKVTGAAIEVNTFWSLIGRIGVEQDPTAGRGPSGGGSAGAGGAS